MLMQSLMRSLYIYYKVRHEHSQAMREALMTLQAALNPQASQRFFFSRRVDSVTASDQFAEQTWMEIYENVAPEFIDELDAALTRAQLMQWINGPRHVESFETDF